MQQPRHRRPLPAPVDDAAATLVTTADLRVALLALAAVAVGTGLFAVVLVTWAFRG
ncbi:hypothetical protein [Natrinema soli]|uniref:Uncharacterized protein n=1 Tax=Natrinema soli TaxID=1930624 RepID=A0ABD5SN05_9EURY|nr:hypothetical protein [Natrinema soli]